MRPIIHDTNEFLNNFWKHFLILEDDLLETSKYVTIDNDNYNTFSIEYNKLYQSIGSEIDVVAKMLSNLLGNSSANKIEKYYNTITSTCIDLTNEKVRFKNSSLIFQPWKNWSESKSPEWWKLYNKVKHERLTICTVETSSAYNKEYYKSANLKNVLNSLSALYILEFYCLLIFCIKNKEANFNSLLNILKSRIFDLEDWKNCRQSFIGEFIDNNTIYPIIQKKIKP